MSFGDAAHPGILMLGGAVWTGRVEAPAGGWEVPFLPQGGGDLG